MLKALLLKPNITEASAFVRIRLKQKYMKIYSIVINVSIITVL